MTPEWLRRKTPYNELPITIALRSIERKVYRDQYCIECGHPFMAISDKAVLVFDGISEVEKMRGGKIIEARCKHSYCKQFYRLEV